ncbi:hypothetical protein [Tautonia plasticadhaerens]|uniref:Laminin G domain protein n=1 Tax=Tautonia plasticadhaerens TaxID=2527974 RepID=A0A518GZ44_9BACT|nr:hypothetical protein [Tautonia plasticadhaerens]QDV33833.1 hypothetical protein ElP_17130 [Tautonia plasticadhaerens]
MIARLACLAVVLCPVAGLADEPDRPAAALDWPLVAASTFDAHGLEGWSFTDADAWRLAEVDGQPVLEQFQKSDYEPEVRSPLNIALMETPWLLSFVLDLEVRSTGRDYGHRDLCLFFGHQDPSHFYYVHLGKEADPHAHSIFLVDGAPRVSIAKERTDGTPWTDDWHHVRLVRNVVEGTIAVYFDDMETPIMTAEDRTFVPGRIGVGSFDDSGQFRNLKIWGQETSQPAAD